MKTVKQYTTELELKQNIRIPDLTSACTSNKYFLYSIKTLKLVINWGLKR